MVLAKKESSMLTWEDSLGQEDGRRWHIGHGRALGRKQNQDIGFKRVLDALNDGPK